MPGPGIAGYITGWQPSSVTPQAAVFARAVVAAARPGGRERAKNLLWAAGKLADWGLGLGLEPVPGVLLHPSVIERFAAHAPGLPAVTRRTLRTNLRFLARRVVPALAPADAPLPRERARRPYSPAEIAGYLALADAQPTAGRRMRAAALICLAAGAGLTGADLRAERGTDIVRRSGGVLAGQRRARGVQVRDHRPGQEPQVGAQRPPGHPAQSGGVRGEPLDHRRVQQDLRGRLQAQPHPVPGELARGPQQVLRPFPPGRSSPRHHRPGELRCLRRH